MTGNSTYTGATKLDGSLTLSGDSGAISGTPASPWADSIRRWSWEIPPRPWPIPTGSTTRPPSPSPAVPLRAQWLQHDATTSQNIGQITLNAHNSIELVQGNATTQTELVSSAT